MVAVGGTAQRGDEEVREERCADLVGLLRVFIGGARRQKREALDLIRGVAQERRLVGSAFDPREAPRRAAVDDRDVDIGGNFVDALAQPRVVVVRAADQDTGLVGVTGVVDDELDPLAELAILAHVLRDRIERAVECARIGLA